MRRGSLLLGAMLLAGLAPGPLAADEKATPAQKDAKSAPREKPFSPGAVFRAKLLHVEGAQRNLTVQITQNSPQQNQQAALNLANCKLQLADAINRRDVGGIRSAQIEMAKNQANLMTFRDEKHKIELDAPEELKVRTLLLPLEYDDKGKPRKLTEKEKKELKGSDPTLPGYNADFDSLKGDQIVDIYLPKGKAVPKVKPGKQENKDGDADAPKLKPVMIVIVAEPPK